MKLTALFTPFLLMSSFVVTSCTKGAEEESKFYDISPGWTKSQVIDFLGEPSKSIAQPFEADFQQDCAAAADSKLVYHHGEDLTLLIFLNTEDEVICSYRHFEFVSH